MKKSLLWLGILATLSAQSTLLATSASAQEVTPKIQARELLNKAELVFSGKVIDIQYKDATDGTPHTFVTYQIDELIAGRPDGDQITLRFLGGRQQKGDVIRYLDVSEAPDFHTGDTDIIFVRKNNTSFCPLVDCSEGRFRNREGVLTSEDGLAVIQSGDRKELGLSTTVINPATGAVIDYGSGMSEFRVDADEPKSDALPANAVKVEQFIADVKSLASGMSRFKDGSVIFKSASIKDDFRAPEFTPVEAKDIAPVLVRAPVTASYDFDRWEEEAVRKNDGNPVLE